MPIIPIDQLEADGNIIPIEQLPEATSPEVPVTIPGELAAIANQVARGTYKGFLALPDLARIGLNKVADMADLDPKVFERREPLSSQIDRATDLGIAKPRTRLGRAVGDTGEIVTGAMAGPGGLTKVGLRSGVGAGLGSTALSQFDPENPLLRLLGGLAGGITPAAISRLIPTKVNLAKDLTRGVDETEFKQALGVMEGAQADNMPLVLAQAMRNPTNLDSGMTALANSKHGVNTIGILRDQPNKLNSTAVMEIEGLPGTALPHQQVSNQVQQAASDHIQGLKDFRSGEVNRLYQGLPDLPTGVGMRMASTIDRLMNKPGQSEDTIAALARLKDKLVTRVETPIPASTTLDRFGNPLTPAGVQVTHQVMTRPLDLKRAISDTIRPLVFNVNNPVDPQVAGQMKHATGMMFDILGAASPQLRQANKRFSDISNNLVNPAKKGIIGTLAGRAGAQADVNAVREGVFGVLKRGTSPAVSPDNSEILAVAKMLNRQNPEIFQSAVKTHMDDMLEPIIRPSSNRTPETIAQGLVQAFGSPLVTGGGRYSKPWRTTLDMLDGIGLSGKEVQGFRRLLTGAANMAVRPASSMGAGPGELAKTTKDSIMNRIGALNTMTMLRQPALGIARLGETGSLKAADKWMSNPKDAQLMWDLAKANPDVNPWELILSHVRAQAVGTRQGPSKENGKGKGNGRK